MKKNIRVLMVLIPVFVLSFCLDSFAQRGMRWKGSGGWGMRSQYCRMFNPNTVETIKGVVTGIEKFYPMRGMSYGVGLIVKTEKETISVHLGPAWFVENQDVKIGTGDKVEVKGSRIIFKGKPAIIAMEVKKEDGILKLRDERGIPLWAAWRRYQ